MVDYNVLTDSDGEFEIETNDLETGIYNINVVFDGDKEYYEDSLSKQIVLVNSPHSIELTISGNVVYKDESLIIDALVKDSNGDIIVNEPVTFYRSDNTVLSTVVTDINGIARHTYIGTGCGNIGVVAKAKDIVSREVSITDIKHVDSIEIESAHDFVFKDKLVIIDAFVKDSSGFGIPYQNIEFYDSNDSLLFSGTTGDNGRIKWKYTGTGNGYIYITAKIGNILSPTITILDIKRPSSITLTVDKDKIEKEETSTISALVKTSDNEIVTNCPVIFYKDNERYESITDINGIAQYTYTGTGAGPINIKASYFRQPVDSLSSIDIIDYLYYDSCSNDNKLSEYQVRKLEYSGTVNAVCENNEYYNLTNTENGSGIFYIKNSLLKGYVFEADCYSFGMNCGLGLIGKGPTVNDNHGYIFSRNPNGFDIDGWKYSNGSFSAPLGYNQQISPILNNNWTHIKITKQGFNCIIEFSQQNSVIYTKTITLSSEFNYTWLGIGVGAGSGTDAYVKNIGFYKIEPQPLN